MQRYRISFQVFDLYLTSECMFCFLYKHLTNKKKSTQYRFPKENTLPFIHGVKVTCQLLIGYLKPVFLSGGNRYKALQLL